MLIDRSDEAKKKVAQAIKAALTEMGMVGEKNTKDEITALGAVDTGNLRNSITYKVEAKETGGSVTIGTNVEYGKYVEYGTSRMAARPFLHNAVINRIDEYEEIAKKYLQDEFN